MQINIYFKKLILWKNILYIHTFILLHYIKFIKQKLNGKKKLNRYGAYNFVWSLKAVELKHQNRKIIFYKLFVVFVVVYY